MQRTLFLIQWDAEKAKKRAVLLELGDWKVVIESQNASRIPAALSQLSPNLVVIDLDTRPAYGLETAYALREENATRQIPIVFVDGDEHSVSKIGTRISNSFHTVSSALSETLERMK